VNVYDYCYQVLAWQASIDVQESIDLSAVNDLKSAIANIFNYVETSLGKEKVIMIKRLFICFP